MRKVTCKDCGKHYDYEVDDFCPRCGSYNPPGDVRSTQMEQELLSRFASSPSRQVAPSPLAKQEARVTGAAQEVDGRRRGVRVETCDSGTPRAVAPPPVFSSSPSRGTNAGQRQRGQPNIGLIVGIGVGLLILVNFILPLFMSLLFFWF